jgi:hypothetical protein
MPIERQDEEGGSLSVAENAESLALAENVKTNEMLKRVQHDVLLRRHYPIQPLARGLFFVVQ